MGACTVISTTTANLAEALNKRQESKPRKITVA
jgi:hypothetical protein